MELGPYTLQVFTSLVVILGAAFVALICDYLKGNNEQLRELTIELKVRRQEEQRRLHLLLAGPADEASESSEESPAKAAARPVKGEAARSLAVPKDRKRAPAAEAVAAMERGAQLAGSPRRTRR